MTEFVVVGCLWHSPWSQVAGVEGSSVLGLLGIPPAGRPGSLHLAPSYLHFQPLHSAVPPASAEARMAARRGGKGR